MSRTWRLAGLAVALILGASEVAAQSSAELVALGDIAYTERRPNDALEHFLRAIASDETNYEALWKASRSEIDLGEIAGNRSALDALLASGQQHAEAAVRAHPPGAEGHFALARALGRRALSVGVRDRIRLARIIRDSALAALKIDGLHAGALHILGMWHAEVMRVNGFSRMIARTFLGAEVFNQASWDEAQRLLEAAVRHDPRRIIHQLDLAGIYADRGDTTQARGLYRQIASAPLLDPNDELYKRQAAERLKRLSEN